MLFYLNGDNTSRLSVSIKNGVDVDLDMSNSYSPYFVLRTCLGTHRIDAEHTRNSNEIFKNLLEKPRTVNSDIKNFLKLSDYIFSYGSIDDRHLYYDRDATDAYDFLKESFNDYCKRFDISGLEFTSFSSLPITDSYYGIIKLKVIILEGWYFDF